MNKRKKKEYPKVTFTSEPEGRLARLGQEDTKVELSEEWLDITAEVANWVESRVNPRQLKGTSPQGLGMCFDWDWIVINVARIPGTPFTIISASFLMEGTDAEFYNEVGDHDWRIFIRGVAFQINRGEIIFHDDLPAFQIIDYLYDDVFTVDALYQRCRSIHSGLGFIMIVIKNLKRRIWLQKLEEKITTKQDETLFSDLEPQKDYDPGPHYI